MNSARAQHLGSQRLTFGFLSSGKIISFGFVDRLNPNKPPIHEVLLLPSCITKRVTNRNHAALQLTTELNNKRESLCQNETHVTIFQNNLSSYFRAWNDLSNNAKIIEISSVEPEICWFEMIYQISLYRYKHSKKSLTIYSYNEASVGKFRVWKIRLWY